MSDQFAEALQTLSRQEQAVLDQRCRGGSLSDIAYRMFIELNTVKNHLTNIYRKFNVRRVERNGTVNRHFGAELCYQLGRYDERTGRPDRSTVRGAVG